MTSDQNIRRTLKPGCCSIVIPVCNAENTLARCIAGIEAQTFSNYEVIFVDDCSEDGTCALIEEQCRKDGRFHMLKHPQRKGAGAARNTGMAAAQGEYLYFADADDELLPALLENAVGALNAAGADLVVFNYCRVFTDGTAVESEGYFPKLLPENADTFSYTDCPDSIMNAILPAPWNKLFRTSFVLNAGVKFEELYSTNDITFCSLIVAIAGKIAILPDSLYRYYVGHANTITSAKEKNIQNVVLAVKSAYRQASELPYFDAIRKSAQTFVVKELLYTFCSFVPDWSTPHAADYYRELHTLFNSEWFDGWDTEESICLTERYAQLFLAVREHPYEAFFEAQRHRLIVSLTSYPERIGLVSQAVDTLLKQTHPADEIVLWLAKEQFPGGETELPENLRAQMQSGSLALKWCDEDLKPHKKYFYAMQQYADCIIVTVDDDLYYPGNMLDKLFISYLRYPKSVSTIRSHLIPFEANGTILPYMQWPKETDFLMYRPCMQLLPTGGAGTLYPPRCFPELADEKEAFVSNCLTADDLWMKMLELHNGVPAVQVGQCSRLKYIPGSQDTALMQQNIGENRNDEQLRNVMAWYDGRYGEGAFFSRLNDSSIGVPQIGVSAYANHIEQWVYPDGYQLKYMHEKHYPAARIDFQNYTKNANNSNTILFVRSSVDMPKAAEWNGGRRNGQIYFLETSESTIRVRLQTRGAGRLKIILKGPNDRKMDGNLFPWWVMYTALTVNGKAYIRKPVLCWHDLPCTISVPCTDNEVFEIETKWRPGEEYIGQINLKARIKSFLKKCLKK